MMVCSCQAGNWAQFLFLQEFTQKLHAHLNQAQWVGGNRTPLPGSVSPPNPQDLGVVPASVPQLK